MNNTTIQGCFIRVYNEEVLFSNGIISIMVPFISYTTCSVMIINIVWPVINYNPRSQISHLYSVCTDNGALQDFHKAASFSHLRDLFSLNSLTACNLKYCIESNYITRNNGKVKTYLVNVVEIKNMTNHRHLEKAYSKT